MVLILSFIQPWKIKKLFYISFVKSYCCVQEDDWSDDRAERQTAEAAKETISKPVEGHQGGATEAQGGGGGVLHAIGETVVEIGQTTKDLLVGKGQTQTTSKESADLNK